MRFSTAPGRIDKEMIDGIIARNSLGQLGMSERIFGGNCPLCGHERSFTIWASRGGFHCFWCGADGRFVAAPERMAEERAKKKSKLAEMVY